MMQINCLPRDQNIYNATRIDHYSYDFTLNNWKQFYVTLCFELIWTFEYFLVLNKITDIKFWIKLFRLYFTTTPNILTYKSSLWIGITTVNSGQLKNMILLLVSIAVISCPLLFFNFEKRNRININKSERPIGQKED